MEKSTSGAGVKSGLSSQSSFAGESAKSLGMDNKGPGQKPVGPAKRKASKGGKDFDIC